jgi:hypothetical protein
MCICFAAIAVLLEWCDLKSAVPEMQMYRAVYESCVAHLGYLYTEVLTVFGFLQKKSLGKKIK